MNKHKFVIDLVMNSCVKHCFSSIRMPIMKIKMVLQLAYLYNGKPYS